jgi:hypothetical protein
MQPGAGARHERLPFSFEKTFSVEAAATFAP